MASVPLQKRQQIERKLLEDLCEAEKVYKITARNHLLAMESAYASNWQISPESMEMRYEAGRTEQAALRTYMRALKAFRDLFLYGHMPSEAETGEQLEALTPREMEVLRLIAAGLSSKEIAERLKISFKTVVCHRSRLMSKLGVHDVVSLVRCAARNNLVEL